MTDTTAKPRETIAAKQAAFSDATDEPEYAAVRQELGLRPHAYLESGPDNHPDRRPCPSWCWVGQSRGEYDHEISVRHPMTARHDHDRTPHVVASLYQGESSCDNNGDRYVTAATIEPVLSQVGQGAPQISVHLRHYEAGKFHFGEILKLTLTDAQELATALTYLVQTADAGQA